MKKVLLFAAIAIICSSCDTVKFDRYPGAMLDSIPQPLRGEYLLVIQEKKNGNVPVDTSTVFIGKNSLTQLSSEKTDIRFLSDSLVFSSFDSSYFLSKRGNDYWECTQLIPSPKGLYIKDIFIPAKASDEKERILKKYFSDVQRREQNGEVLFYVKMDEKKLLKYAKKELKKAKIELKKVQ